MPGGGSWHDDGTANVDVVSNSIINAGGDGIGAWTHGNGSADVNITSNAAITAGDDGIYAWDRK